ncbi:hypothetical protein KSF_087160 [Reticulibacter mediterranei]|uniref:Uncharacterized protein n=2 Tax=Reticulibacter mediterranei TaxID=2778369 RepID=A0A8J3IU89_9CHLR|nr:hypothetical protein KSF_087160 [Reticulibacter mediterranei]
MKEAGASAWEIFGQSLPHASKGAGQQILYRCSLCQRPWFLDGREVYLRLEPEQLHWIAVALEADLEQLPTATCRLCLFQRGLGSFEFDEYGLQGEVGYGINWEAASPVGAHLLAAVLSEGELRRLPVPPSPHVVYNYQRARAVLTWLKEERSWLCERLLSAFEQGVMAADNPPGHGMSGTEGWQWKGAFFHQHCPPLGGMVRTQLVIALPADEPLEVHSLVALWQDMAALALEGSFVGEHPGEKEQRR